MLKYDWGLTTRVSLPGVLLKIQIGLSYNKNSEANNYWREIKVSTVCLERAYNLAVMYLENAYTEETEQIRKERMETFNNSKIHTFLKTIFIKKTWF